MNDAALTVALVLARNCKIRCGFFIFRGCPRCRSPPGFLKFHFSNFKKNGGMNMYYDPKETARRIVWVKMLNEEQLDLAIKLAKEMLNEN